MLSVVVRLPFARRPRALPVLFRLNVPRKKCDMWGVKHKKMTKQLSKMLSIFADAFPERKGSRRNNYPFVAGTSV